MGLYDWLDAFDTREMEFDDLQFTDVRELSLAGLGWSDTAEAFDRLPARAQEFVTERVWQMSIEPAGVTVSFESDAAALGIRWTLAEPLPFHPRMTAVDLAGFDLYAELPGGLLHWCNAKDPGGNRLGVDQHGWFFQQIDAFPEREGFRRYQVFFPNGARVRSVEIGCPAGSTVRPWVAFSGQPILYYGTSIVHGRHASRPGMTHANQLSRRLGREILNLGFGGAAKMEEPLAHLLAEQHPLLWIIDPVPNMDAELIRERAMVFLDVIRAKHPKTPMLMVEDRVHADAPFFAERRKKHAQNREAWREVFANRVAAGDRNLRYLGSDSVLGIDGEATNDASHPTDLGFTRYADILEPVLRRMLDEIRDGS